MDRTADTQPADAELVARFLDGEEAAFDLIVVRHRREVYRLAWRLTGNHAEADDLAQETFCRAYTGLAGFRGDASLKTWLCRIVTNLSLNVVQSARLTRRDGATLEDLERSGLADATQVSMGADDLVRRERNEKLRQAIEGLPKKQRSTLMLRAFEGLQYREIARMMGCSIGTAKANFFHAVASLRRELKDYL